MFFKEKKLSKQGKIIERDLGFNEDTFGLVCDAVAFEDHCEGDFISTEEDSSLLDKDFMRRIRTRYLDMVASKCKGNSWCKVKHLCRVAKGCQELGSRFLSMGNIEEAKKCSMDYGECYMKFLELIKFDEKDIGVKSSA